MHTRELHGMVYAPSTAIAFEVARRQGGTMRTDDPYSRVDYRRLVAWPQRIEREWPFLERALGASGRVIDLGSGTGEHSRFLASKGFEVVGIDASPAMLSRATDTPLPSNLTFVEGDITDVERLTSGIFDGAICLGNTLPHLRDLTAMARFAAGLRRRLRPGAAFLLQVLNYDKVLDGGQRSLPLTFRKDEGEGEIVFLRLMTPQPDGSVVFTPTTLRYRPEGDPAVEVVSARNVQLKGWRRRELEDTLDAAGFTRREVFGTVGNVPFDPTTSPDIVIVAR
jgi:SAM-dependent methyltransferase